MRNPAIARYLGIKPEDLVFIAEYCGGGFGSKGSGYPLVAISGLLSKKANGRPVMLRVSREEEYANGSARAAFQGWAKIGFAENGRITALDIFLVQDNGPNIGWVDFRNAGGAVEIVFQPEAMRWRGTPVLTNTPPRGPQRGPGENQTAMTLEPMIDEAARQLGIDRLEIRRINAPDNDGFQGADAKGKLTSAYLKDALVKGGELFNWEEKKKLSGQRNGNKVIGVGIGSAFHAGGMNGFDGLVRILPDGKLYIHSRSRQSRHLLLRGDLTRRRRSAGLQLGQCRHRPWPNRQPSAVDGHPGRFEHDLHRLAGQLRGGGGCQEQAARDRRH